MLMNAMTTSKMIVRLLAFFIANVLSYRFGYMHGMEHSNKSASATHMSRNASFTYSRTSPSLYEYTTHHECRVISYERMPVVDFPSVRLKVNSKPYICVYNRYNEDQFVSHSIMKYGVWENRLVDVIVQMLKADKELAFIDIGSSIGQFSLVAASMGRKVIAVDAFVRHTLMLARAVVLNNYQNLVRIVHNALSNTYRNISLVAFSGNPDRIRMKTNEYATMPVAEQVPTILMDDLVHVVDFRRALMKINIAGQEVPALLQSVKLFTKVNIPVIIMEWRGGYRNWCRTDEEKAMVTLLLSFFKTRGYRVYNTNMTSLDVNNWDHWPFHIIWKR